MSTSVQFKTEVLGDDIQESQNRDKRPVPMTVEDRILCKEGSGSLGSRSIHNNTDCKQVAAIIITLLCPVGGFIGGGLLGCALVTNVGWERPCNIAYAISAFVGATVSLCCALSLVCYMFHDDPCCHKGADGFGGDGIDGGFIGGGDGGGVGGCGDGGGCA